MRAARACPTAANSRAPRPVCQGESHQRAGAKATRGAIEVRPALSACKRAASDTLPQLQPLSVGFGNHRAWCSNVWKQWTMHYASLPLIPETVKESRAADTPTAYPLTAHPSRSAGCGPPDVPNGWCSNVREAMDYALCTMPYGLPTMHYAQSPLVPETKRVYG